MLGILDSESPYAAQGMHSCCSGSILCSTEVIYGVHAAYAAHGWGPRAEETCPGGGNSKGLGPTKQPNREPDSKRAESKIADSNLSR